MRAEFNGNGFMAEMNSSFGPRGTVNLSRLYSGSIIISILAFAMSVLSLASTFAGHLGVDILTQLFSAEAQQLSIRFTVISLSAATIACFLAIWAMVLRGTVKKTATVEETAFYSASTFISVFSFVIIALCIILNAVFLLT